MSYVINAEELFAGKRREAEKMVERPDKVEHLLKRLESKLRSVPKLGGTLATVPQLGMLINSWIRGDYREIPIGSIVAALAAVIYFVSPIDLIPDAIPVIGHLDDAGVVGFVLHMIKTDLDEYMEWRQSVGLDTRRSDKQAM